MLIAAGRYHELPSESMSSSQLQHAEIGTQKDGDDEVGQIVGIDATKGPRVNITHEPSEVTYIPTTDCSPTVKADDLIRPLFDSRNAPWMAVVRQVVEV